MEQRTDEWLNLDAEALRYHTAQWESPKRGTIAFEQFCRAEMAASTNIIDLGAGAGACTAFLAAQHPGTRFTAFDYSHELVAIGRQVAARQVVPNLRFAQGDWYDLRVSEGFDGVVSLQTLSWLPDHERALQAIFEKLRPDWIGLTSLFHEADISCRIEVHEHKRDRKSYYNVHSLPAIARFCERHGYALERWEPFRMDIDLPPPRDPDRMGTYTRRLLAEDGRPAERLQVSGPVLMSWYMVLLRRRKAG